MEPGAPRLAERGYRAIMLDLRGHGDSPHAEKYTPELLAGDLVESLPAGADFVIGHSFGVSVLSLSVADLTPSRVVYSDLAGGSPTKRWPRSRSGRA